MKNFIQPGETITITAPANVASSSPVMLGNIFGVATNDALKDQDLELKLTGVFTLPKVPTETWKTGALVYWNEVANALTNIGDNNQLVGVSISNTTALNSNGVVRLNATFMPKSLTSYDDVHGHDIKGLNGAKV